MQFHIRFAPRVKLRSNMLRRRRGRVKEKGNCMDAIASPDMNDNDEAARMRAWLEEVLRQTGLKPTPLAKAAGLAPSTILRALDPSGASVLDTRTIAKIVDKFQVAGPPTHSSVPANGGLAESELTFEPDDAGHAFAGEPLTPTQGLWRVHTRLLDLAGYLPGDVLLADSATRARPGDVVVAQHIDGTGTAETLLRVYDPPYLLTDPVERNLRRKPLLVDGERVSIWGVVVKTLRLRAA
jgi:DNA-binding phage protein